MISKIQGGGVKAIQTFSKQKEIFLGDGFLNAWDDDDEGDDNDDDNDDDDDK